VTLQVLLVLIFLASMGLVISALYFAVAAPAEKKQLRTRFAVLRDLAQTETGDLETLLLRSEVVSNIPAIHRLLIRLPGMKGLQLYVQQSATPITVGMLLLLSFLGFSFAALAVLALRVPALLALIVGAIVGSVPWIVMAVLRQRRFLRFEELFPDAMDLLARAVRAGHAFTSGLEMIAKEMPKPVSEEFQKVYDQQNLGLPLRDALANLVKRMPLPDVRIFVTALMIQRESGGNLAEILDNLSMVIRERFKLMRQIKVYTAQGRLTLIILTIMPPFFLLMSYLMRPDYIKPLFTEPEGHRLLIYAIVLQIIGFFVIRKIVQPKV
jgi:tight adherence protein B